MKISLNWLKKYVDFKSSPEELAESLTMAGLEVESIEYPFEYLKDVITGKIEKITPHPDADKLRICMVNTGGDENLQIVCGAPNVYEGMTGPVALPGTELPGGLKLKKSKIRGMASFGMLCSAKELDLTDDSSGIMDLDKEIKPGTPLLDALGLTDAVLEVDLTPNRADCLSMIGVAREVAAIENSNAKLPDAEKYSDKKNKGKITDIAAVEVKDTDLCPKYCARLIENVKIKPSPWYIQQRLLSAGLRPLNNIVDITNYIMLETGQPLHAFDFNELGGSKIVVQRAGENEKFVTLDGKERTLDSEMLMICDAQRKVAVAGVMGGENSEVTQKTTSVLLESAYFYPPSVRRTAKKIGLSTDASHRFERGIDTGSVEYAMNRAAELIEEVSEGKTIEGYLDSQTEEFKKTVITFDTDACNKRLGIELSPEESASYLESVGFKVADKTANKTEVKVPSYRVDVERPEDLSEEIARRFGYNKIKTTFPGSVSAEAENVPEFDLRLEIKDALQSLGFNEVINYSFTGPSLLEKTLFDSSIKENSVKILNPLSEDQSLMRTDLVPEILGNIADNIAKQTFSLKLFEVGQVFFPDSDKINLSSQKEIISAAWTGSRRKSSWDEKSPDTDFFDIKGVAEAFFEKFNITPEFVKSETAPCYSRPGASADILINNKKAGFICEIHHTVIKNLDINQPVFVFQTYLNDILKNKQLSFLSGEIPKFPAVSRDITIITPTETATGDIINFFSSQDENLLESVELFDVYQGKPIAENEKSLSFRLTYRSNTDTLKDKQINKVHEKLTSKLLKNFNIRFP